MAARLDTEDLNALIQVSKTVNAHLDLDGVLESVLTVATQVMGAEASSLVLIDDDTGDLLFHVAQGESAKAVKPLRMKPGEGVVGHVIQSGESAVVNDVAKDPRFFNKIDATSGFKTRSILCVPLVTPDRLWGAVELLNKSGGQDFDEHDVQLCEAMAAHASIAIENAVLHKRILKAERLAAVGETMAGLAHCVKNVLHCIRGGSYTVDVGLRKQDEPMVSKGWDIVKRNNAFMEELVLDMLTYSRDRQPQYESVNINEIVRAVAESAQPAAAEKGTTIACALDENLGAVEVDPKGIRRCLLNLVSNATDACHTTQEGRVDIRTDADDGLTFRIAVSDNGCGICDEDMAKLFTLFFSTKGSRGTGLGLAVTHKIILEHEGTIEAHSKVGQGTRFTVALPRNRPHITR